MPESSSASPRPADESRGAADPAGPKAIGAGSHRVSGTTAPYYQPASEAGATPVAESALETEAFSSHGTAVAPVAEKRLASPQEMFEKDFAALGLVSSIASIVAGALVIAFPTQLAEVLQFDGASELWLRLLGALGVVIGIMVAAISRGTPRRDTIGLISTVYLGSTVFFVGAPFAFGVNVGWLGWLVLSGAALFTFTASLAWFFLHDWLTPVPDYVPERNRAPKNEPLSGPSASSTTSSLSTARGVSVHGTSDSDTLGGHGDNPVGDAGAASGSPRKAGK